MQVRKLYPYLQFLPTFVPMNIVITGASNGIGYETALLFANDSSNHILAISRDQTKLDGLKKEADKFNPHNHLTTLSLDISVSGFETELVTSLENVFNSEHPALHTPIPSREGNILSPNIQLLINNAGNLIAKPFGELTDNDFKQVYTVNFFAPVRIIRALLPFMGKSSTHIVNIGSMGGMNGTSKFTGLTAYSSSKAALAVLSECLATEFEGKGISVNCLALGSVQTEMLTKAFPGYKAPLQPAEMAKFIVEFAINGSKYFNGKTLPVALSNP